MRMVPAETQESRTDSFPKPQSVTQLDGSVTMASTNGQEENESIGHTSVTAFDGQERVQSSEAHVCDGEMPPVHDEDVSLRIPEISQPCVSLAEAVAEVASTELLLLNVEALIGEEFAFPFPDPVSTLDIQGSSGSDQGVQGTCLSPFSSEQMASTAASSVNHSEAFHTPSNSYGGSTTVNALADTYLPMVQNPPRHLFSDPYEYELEKLRREEEYLKNSFEKTTSVLMAELESKMDEARSKYDRESKELDDAYIAKAKEEEVNRGFVESSSLLANAFVSKCSDRSESSDLAAIRAVISQQLAQQQQQQAVRTNTHVASTAPPHRPSVTTSQPRPISQQAVQANTPVASTAPPRPLVTAAKAPIPNPSGPVSYSPSCTTTQPTLMSQQANTPVASTPPRPSVAAAAPPISNPLSRFPCRNTSPPRPLSQQPAVQSNTPINSTAPPRPSVTAAEPLVPLARFTSQPRPMSQQPVVQSDTHMNSTSPPPPPSVTAVELPTPSHSRPFSHSPRSTTTQPNTNVNPTALARTSVTSEPLPLHTPRTDTPRPRPPPVISNVTPSSSQPVYGRVRGPAPHLRPFRSSPAPNSAAAATTHPTRLVQEQQQGNSKGGLVYLSDDEE